MRSVTAVVSRNATLGKVVINGLAELVKFKLRL